MRPLSPIEWQQVFPHNTLSIWAQRREIPHEIALAIQRVAVNLPETTATICLHTIQDILCRDSRLAYSNEIFNNFIESSQLLCNSFTLKDALRILFINDQPTIQDVQVFYNSYAPKDYRNPPVEDLPIRLYYLQRMECIWCSPTPEERNEVNILVWDYTDDEVSELIWRSDKIIKPNITAKIQYNLSAKGRKYSLLRHGDGKKCQELSATIRPSQLRQPYFSVLENGEVILSLLSINFESGTGQNGDGDTETLPEDVYGSAVTSIEPSSQDNQLEFNIIYQEDFDEPFASFSAALDWEIARKERVKNAIQNFSNLHNNSKQITEIN